MKVDWCQPATFSMCLVGFSNLMTQTPSVAVFLGDSLVLKEAPTSTMAAKPVIGPFDSFIQLITDSVRMFTHASDSEAKQLAEVFMLTAYSLNQSESLVY